ncbi:MAG: hypothetical protein KatS3mg111_1592 [Pirellulaceae bacterium]|nr:MAG: hypothetical protein KatS3mg111_1592 [Pirellulaceae bacterium]
MEVPREQLAFFAGALVFGGMFFDMLDGQAARWLRQTSEFGAELDSLCDVITFGVAPVFILLLFGDIFPARVIFGIGVIYVACVLLRLARFNVNASAGDRHESFDGLPSPAAAGTIASFAIAMPAIHHLSAPDLPVVLQNVGTWMLTLTMLGLPVLMLALSFLLVSRIPYPHVVNRWVQRGYNFNDLAQGIIVAIAAVTIHELALPLVFCGFVVSPLLRGLSKRLGGDRDARGVAVENGSDAESAG